MQATSELILCTRCGQAIKNVCDFDGKPYGADCWEVVSGYRADQYANIQRAGGIAQYEAKVRATEEANVEYALQKSANVIANAEYIKALRTADEAEGNLFRTFKTDMADALERGIAFEELSQKQQRAIRTIHRMYN